MKDMTLEKELRAVGANTTEVDSLGKIADTLRVVHAPKLSAAAKQRITARLPIDIDDIAGSRHHRMWRWSLVSTASFAVLLVAFSAVVETAPPHSPFYGVKQTAARMINGKDQKTSQPTAPPAVTPAKQPVAAPTIPAITSTYTPPKQAASPAAPSQSAPASSSTAPASHTTTHAIQSFFHSLFFWT